MSFRKVDMEKVKRRARLISLLPFNKLRVFLYRNVLGYNITDSYIARKTLIAVKKADFDNCSIGPRNAFIGPMSVKIGKQSKISPGNSFNCADWVSEEKFLNAGYEKSLVIGEGCLITSDHHFDVVGKFELGSRSWIAGNGSQFWTHGAGSKDHNIFVDCDCYIGSAVRFAPGAFIGKNNIVGIGSIVTKKFIESNCIIAGNPARILQKDYDWKTRKEI